MWRFVSLFVFGLNGCAIPPRIVVEIIRVILWLVWSVMHIVECTIAVIVPSVLLRCFECVQGLSEFLFFN
jgi:hypothetical protein